MRGGTSRAVIFHRHDLPSDRADWDRIFLAVMGSPDRNGRQLDGMGGGISSLSKVCVVGPPTVEGADVDYTFVQVSVTDASVDYAGNCGNMSSAIGPFAVDEGIVPHVGNGQRHVVIHNTNTGKLIRAIFDVVDGSAAVDGELEIDGVSGSGAPVKLEFLEPGGAKTGKLLPTGNVTDRLQIRNGLTVDATLIDAANPCVFLSASDFGKRGTETADELEADTALMEDLESARCQASVAMGLAATVAQARTLQSIPKVALIFAPQVHRLASGRVLAVEEFDIGIRMISMGRPHRAVPITGAVCLAVAMRLPHSLPSRLMTESGGALRVGHPSGVVSVDAQISEGPMQGPHADFGSVYRTARRLFEGSVLYR